MVGNSGKRLLSRLIHPFFISSALFCVFVYGGVLKIKDRTPYGSLVPVYSLEEIIGTICSNPVKNQRGTYYSLNLSLENVTGQAGKASVTSSAHGVLRCLVPTNLVEALYPGRLYSQSGKKILFENGEKVRLKGSFASGFFICTDGFYCGHQKSVSGNLIHFRALCRLKFKKLMYGWKECGGFILSLLSGSREYTDSTVMESFRRAGLSHILALSGMHLSFFSSLAGGTGKKILGKKFSFWLRLIGIIFFVWFAGLSPSLLRALICSLTMLLCGAVFSLETDFFIVLCFSFIIHCVISPADIFSTAFILSYGALAGILLLGDFFNSIFSRFLPKNISDSLSASISAQSATAPVSIVMFGTVMPVGIIASVVVSPMVTFFLTVGVFSIAICLVMPFLSPLFGCIMKVLYMVIVTAVKTFAFFPPVKF